MTTSTKKMSPTDAIVMMIDAVNKGDDGKFYQVVTDFTNTLAFGGGNYHRIRNAVRMKPTRLRKIDDLPSNIKTLLIQQGSEDENVFLPPGIHSLIETLLIEWEHAEVYRLHKIPPRHKILLHGPTGNGKTTIAKYIARKSNLPVVEINSDLVIDSKLGGTSGNIYNIMSSITEPCVLFWDEIDSIGSRRGGDGHAAGTENDRMVNSILINLQRLHKNVIFIGATNRMDILDEAFLRRFDIKMEVPAPSLHQLQEYVVQLTKYHNIQDHVMGCSLDGVVNYSDAKLRLTEKIRSFIISKIK